jgi:CrcB protein
MGMCHKPGYNGMDKRNVRGISMNALAIAIGGAIGSLGRFALSLILPSASAATLFPWSTFLANLSGCFLIGFLYQISDRANLPQTVRLGLGTGVLGGFTTFSAFSLELLRFIQAGHILMAFIYAAASLAAGLALCYIGIVLAGRGNNRQTVQGTANDSNP